MKPGYMLHIYMGHYFRFLSSKTCLIQYESYQQSPEKTKNDGENERQY